MNHGPLSSSSKYQCPRVEEKPGFGKSLRYLVGSSNRLAVGNSAGLKRGTGERRFHGDEANMQDTIDFRESMCYSLPVRPADRMLLVIKT